MPATENPTRQLKQSLDSLEKTLKESHGPLDPAHQLLWQFVRGLAYGLGILFAGVIVAPLLVWSLAQIDWVPLFSQFLERIMEEVQQTRLQ